MNAPLPEVTNLTRACWAEVAIRTFRQQTGTDLEDVLCDLLCDLMHWADVAGYDFALAFDRARDHYEAERLEGEGVL